MAGRGLIVLGVVALLAPGLAPGGTPAAAVQPGVVGLVYAEGERLMVDGEPFLMKGYNYFPRDYGWTSLVDWDWEEVDTELALAREYGANTVRTGFDYWYLTGDVYCRDPFGRCQALPEYLDAIDRFLSIAAGHDLKVVFWLGAGPCWGDLWDPANYGVIEKHLESLIPRFAGDPRIAAWDLATDLDGTMVQVPPLGAYGSDPRATRDNMVTLLANMAGTVRSLDPHHLLTVGFCWPSSSLLVQDFTDFLMPQFLGGDAPNLLVADEAAAPEYYGRWDEYPADPEGAVDRLVAKVEAIRAGLRRPMPFVLAEYGSPTRGGGYSASYQSTVYQAVLETSFLRLGLAGALNWVLTDFTWPPRAFTLLTGMLSEEEQSFGILDADYQPKPAAQVAAAFYADHPDIRLEAGPTELDFAFERSFVPGESDQRRLSVAFDWIEFRDGEGRTILKLDVGAPEARPYLQRGFYADEGPWGETADDFAWAGGPEQVARMGLVEGTEMVVFRALTNGSMRVDVLAEGVPVTAVTVGSDWGVFAVALPSPEPASVGVPHTLRGTISLPVSTGTAALAVSYDGTNWEDAGSAVPDRGRFAVPVRFEHGGSVLVRPTWSGAGLYGPAVGEPARIEVTAAPSALGLAAPVGDLTIGEEAVVVGSFAPEVAGIKITAALTRPDGSQAVSSTATGADGRFELRFTPDQEGGWSATAIWEGDGDYQASEGRVAFSVQAAPSLSTLPTTTQAAGSAGPDGAGAITVGLWVGLAAGVTAAGGTGLVLWRLRCRRSAPR